eukprot:6189159-Pyramimonas_sp.AAC.1
MLQSDVFQKYKQFLAEQQVRAASAATTTAAPSPFDVAGDTDMPQAQQPEASTPTPVRSPANSVWADAADEPVPIDEDDPD